MAFDIARWNEGAAVSRCLLELVRRTQGRTLDPAQFVAAHLARYPHWAAAPGSTDTLGACELAREMGLATSVRVSVDPDQVIRESKQPGYAGALLFLERWPAADSSWQLSQVSHCVLAVRFDEQFLLVWNPFQDGSASESPWSWKSWPKLMMHALVLSR